MVAYYLGTLGLDTVQAATGPEALDKARHCHVALVELVLPHGSGIGLAAQLRSAGVAVIIHSSWVTSEARESVAAAGIPFLPKCTDLKMLAEVVLQAWHRVAA